MRCWPFRGNPQTLTLSFDVVVIVDVDGDGDVAVDDCSACQVQLLHESPCSDAACTYAIARGSAMECAAVLDALFVLKVVNATTKQRGDELLERIVGMLTRLCR